ncbi:MAG TPA: GNAT family protein [Candidatus Dormibacteraeota bacterium]|nr:GNAT family protein [Candidatus Dormibacteraeota bacterium]
MLIRPLRVDDAEAHLALRQRALREEPMAFLSSPEDDVARTVDAVRAQLRRAPEEAVVFGAFAAELIGIVGLHRDHHRKAAHKVHLWGMYVAPAHRRQGVAASLLGAALAHARSLPGVAWAHLSVSESAPAARRVYERAGFQLWGSEPDALRHAGRTAVEHHLAIRLD